jgi:hypothetical protein
MLLFYILQKKKEYLNKSCLLFENLSLRGTPKSRDTTVAPKSHFYTADVLVLLMAGN